MHDARAMRLIECRGNFNCRFQRLAQIEGAATQSGCEGFAFEVFEDEVVGVSLMADIVDGADMWMIQCRCSPRLLRKAAQSISVGGPRLRKHLDGHIAAETGIASTIDLAHPARAQQALNPIRPD